MKVESRSSDIPFGPLLWLRCEGCSKAAFLRLGYDSEERFMENLPNLECETCGESTNSLKAKEMK